MTLGRLVEKGFAERVAGEDEMQQEGAGHRQYYRLIAAGATAIQRKTQMLGATLSFAGALTRGR